VSGSSKSASVTINAFKVSSAAPAELSVADSNLALLVLSAPLRADQHPVRVYLRSLSPGSRRTMLQALDVIAGLLTGGRHNALSLSWGALRYQHSAAIASALGEQYAPSTANKMLAALRGVLKAAWRLEQISTEDYQRAIDFSPLRGETLPAGRSISSGELRALFHACAHDIYKDGTPRPTAVRDAAVLAVLYGVGLRRSEVITLDFEDYNAENGELRIRRAKGRKDRLSYAGRGAREAIAAWLQLRGESPGPLFWPILKSGRLVPRRLSDQAILTLLMKRAKEAGVKHLSPHDMRRSFISDLLDAGADISAVQKLAGHANVSTTIRYDRRGEAAKQKASELLHVPYSSSDK
jgi:site-specific recombinase XerD